MTREEFIRQMMPYAMSVSQQTGIDPRIVIAQSALETGYGRSAPNNNFFGIKGPGQKLTTSEFGPGGFYKTQDSFRTYGSMADSAQGYADFINKNPRYRDLKSAQGLDAQLAALQKSGYATDPNYGSKVGSIARNITIDPSIAGSAPPAATPATFMGMPSRPVTPTPSTAAAAPATPQTLMGRLQSGTPSPLATSLGMSAPTANTVGNIGGLLSAMLGGGSQPAAQAPAGYENRPDPRKLEELFGGLLA